MNIEIRKSISRKINTAQYENVVISCDLRISIDTIDESDLIKIQQEVTEKLLLDYKNTEIKVLKEIGLTEKPAFIESKTSNIDVVKKIELTAQQESELFG